MYQNLLQEKIICAPGFFHVLMASNDNQTTKVTDEPRRFSMRLGDKEISYDTFMHRNVTVTETSE